MTLEKVMSTSLITLDMDDTLETAKKLFEEHRIHHLLIIDSKKLIGIINEKDLFKNLSPTVGTAKETSKDVNYLQTKVHLVMNRDLITAKKDLPIKEAVLLFHDHHISCLPVVDQEFNAIGIITWRDIIKLIAIHYRQNQQGSATKKDNNDE